MGEMVETWTKGLRKAVDQDARFKSLCILRFKQMDRLYKKVIRIVLSSLPDDAEKLYPVIETIHKSQDNRSRSRPASIITEAGRNKYKSAKIESTASPQIPSYLRVPKPQKNFMTAL